MPRHRLARLALCALIAAPPVNAQTVRFSWLPRSVDPGEIRIESPPYLPGQDLGFKPLRHQSWIKRGEVLVQVGEGAQARAYPLRLLAAFRVITDKDAAGPFAVSYCVPCAWIRVFRLPKGMEEAQFSGLWSAHGLDAAEKNHPAALDPLFYDPATGSLFSHRQGRVSLVPWIPPFSKIFLTGLPMPGPLKRTRKPSASSALWGKTSTNWTPP